MPLENIHSEPEGIDYFENMLPDKIYVSAEFDHTDYETGEISSQTRIVQIVVDHSETHRVEKVDGHLVIRETPRGRDQVKVMVYGNKPDTKRITLQRFSKKTGNPQKKDSFSFSKEEWQGLMRFLQMVDFIDFESTSSKFQIRLDEVGSKYVKVDEREKAILEILNNSQEADREKILGALQGGITKKDLDILSGRKGGLQQFEQALAEQNWSEKQWQSFFESNTWIFGYGLDYQFLEILQREAAVSSVDVGRSNRVDSDFLMSTRRFTVLVELKRPDTKLFENQKNRSESWRLSTDLTDAVSQILAQKAEWQIKSQSENHTTEGELIEEKTHDPKAILVIGHTQQFSGNNKNSRIKAKTFELYRRNSRNIEILTYDELLERARFIVEHQPSQEFEVSPTSHIHEHGLDDDELPF